MGINHILVHVEPGAGSERRVRYALSMAERFGAKVTGIAVTVPPTTVAFAMMGDAQLYGAAVQAATESSDAAREQFRSLTRAVTVKTEWHEAEGVPVEIVAAEAGSADLLILGREDSRDPDAGFYDLAPADLVMTCGRPVLVLPEQGPDHFSGKRILVGWKNTAEATRAAHEALPILQTAESVMLAEIQPRHASGRYAIATASVVDHLRGHGVAVTHLCLKEDGEPGEQLIKVAGEQSCDLIVAGAYGHSRVREWVLGGVTHSLIHSGGLPCLLSH